MKKNIKQTIIFLGLTIALFGCSTERIDSAVKNGATKLSGHEIRELLTGSTVKSQGYGQEAEIKYLGNGNLSAKNKDNDKDVGVWQVDNNEMLCIKFRKWGQGDKLCYWLYKEGREYKQFNKSGILAYSFTITEQGGSKFQEGVTFTDQKSKTVSETTSASPQNTATRISVPAQPISPEDLKFIVRKTARNCPGCNLAHAQLSGANLLNANLEGANLTGADLSGTVLRHANLEGANLYKTNLRGANLSGANLTGANLTDADMADANLAGAVGIK